MSDVLLALAAAWIVLSLALGLAIVRPATRRRETVVRPLTLSEIERLGKADPMPVDMPDRILERLDDVRPYA